MSSHTLRSVAREMRAALKDDVPSSAQQQGAFAATVSWADFLDQRAQENEQ